MKAMQQPHRVGSTSVVNPAAVLVHGTEEVVYVSTCQCGSRFTDRDMLTTIQRVTHHVTRLAS